MYGVHLSPSAETRQKISEKSSSPVMQFDLDGGYITTYASRKVAAEAIGGSAEMISSCCCGRKKSHKGFQWCNVGDEHKIGVYHSNEKPQKPIAQIKDGVVVHVFDGVNEANRYLGKSGSNISSCLHGKLKTAYGFEWCYLCDIDSTFYLKTS